MSKLFVVGDTHGFLDIEKLQTFNFPISKELTKDDILVVLGDWGAIWYGDNRDKKILKWWENKPWTTFVVLGNHSNYDAIEKLPTTIFGDELCYQAGKSLYVAMSGKVYDLCGQKCLVVNGADSHDIFVDGKRYRHPHTSWWEQEQITEEDVEVARINIAKCRGTVDYVFSHTGGTKICNFLGFSPTISDKRLDKILDEVIYKEHFCGHYHIDKLTPDGRILYDDVRMIATDEKQTIF